MTSLLISNQNDVKSRFRGCYLRKKKILTGSIRVPI
nr:MAG TPA: hypothetical protein [Caudoviricetes sp.]